MGWFGSGPPSKVSTVEVLPEDEPQQFLEDLPPKFEDREPVDPRGPTYIDAIKLVKISDFTMDRYVQLPCFREAMITGFQAMGVLGSVTFLIHKNPRRSVNWAIGGFFLGNLIGYEQCHSLRRKSRDTMEKARQANLAKNKKKWEEGGQIVDDEQTKKWKEVQEHNETK